MSAANVAPPTRTCADSTAPQQNPDRFDVTTDAVRRTGTEISQLQGSVLLNPVDPSLLSEKVVGHAGLARALQDLVEYWHNELGAYAAHLDDTGQQLEQAASRYSATDDDTADTLSALDPDPSQPPDQARDRT